MASELIDSHKSKAEIYHDEEICKKKSIELLEEYSLPKGLLRFEIAELGHDKSSGFVWFKAKTKQQHKFKLISKTVSFNTVITMFMEKGRARDVKGIQAKELLIWVDISGISVDDPASGKIIFSVPNGLKRAFPIEAFEMEEEEIKKPKYAIAK